MEVLFDLNDITLVLLFVSCALACGCQGAHLFMCAFRRGEAMHAGAMAYEVLVLVHLTFASMVLREACTHYAYVSLWSRSFCVAAIDASWVHVAPVALGAYLMVAARKPVMSTELAVMACWLPPAVLLLAGAWPWIVAAGVAFMVFRSLACVVLDYQRAGEVIMRFSLAEVVGTVSEGILCYERNGRILLANDTMRRLFESLGHRGVLVDARELRRKLLDGARVSEVSTFGDGGGGGTDDPARIVREARIETPDATVWHLMFDEVRLGRERCERVIATDVTELTRLNEGLDAANAELSQMEDELRASLAVVDATAELDALVQMRTRVHDVIGQRLSILHRALEDSDLSHEHLGELREMVDGIMDDLVSHEHIDPRADLVAVVHAFALIGVEIAVIGSLPNADEVADMFVHIIREAVTNAVRHARATVVEVSLGSCDGDAIVDGAMESSTACGCWTLEIRDNGTPLKEVGGFGLGIPGMRRAVAEAGGVLRVEATPQFIVRAVVPRGASDRMRMDIKGGTR